MTKLPLYNNIRMRREAIGMTQDELAALSGYKGKSAIARIENGEIDLPANRIIAIARALKTTPGKLMDGDIAVNKEAELIYNYRDASDEIKESAFDMIQKSADRNRTEEEKTTIA